MSMQSLVHVPFVALGNFRFGCTQDELTQAAPSEIRLSWNEQDRLTMIFVENPCTLLIQTDPAHDAVIVDVQGILQWTADQGNAAEKVMEGFFLLRDFGITVSLHPTEDRVERICILSRQAFEATYSASLAVRTEPEGVVALATIERTQKEWRAALKLARLKVRSSSLFQPLRLKSWTLAKQRGTPKKTQSGFGGPGWLLPDEKALTCAACGFYLVPVFQFSSEDLPKSSPIIFKGLFQFSICGDSDCFNDHTGKAGDPRSLLRVIEPSQVPLLRKSPGIKNKGEPEESYLDDKGVFRAPKAVVPSSLITDLKFASDFPILSEPVVEDSLVEEVYTHLYPVDRDKWGGWPLWAQDPAVPDCRKCATADHQVFFLQLCPAGALQWWWGGDTRALFFQCSKHTEEFSVVSQGT